MATSNPTPVPGSLPPTIHISFKLVAIVVAALLLIAVGVRVFLMHSVFVGVGEEIVFIDKPYLWGKPGVRDTSLKVGRKTEFNSTTEIRLTVAPRAYEIAVRDLPTKGPQLVNVDTVIRMRITNAPDLVNKFGVDWFDNAFMPTYPSLVRNVIGKRSIDSLVNDADTLKQVEVDIADDVRTMLSEDGIAVELIDLSIRRIEPGTIPVIPRIK